VIVMQTLESPIGMLHLYARGDALVAVELPNRPQPSGVPGAHSVLAAAAAQLREYFAGARTRFELPLAPEGTSFQRRVWTQLLAIPYGTTCSYADVARAIGRPTACRAVGAANGKNPIAIIVPCHRVIGAGGALTGYGGGLPTKRWLLQKEGTVSTKTTCAQQVLEIT